MSEKATNSGNGKKRQAPAPQPGADTLKMMNNPDADAKAKRLLEKLDDQKRKRSAINAEITKIRKDLYAMGHKRDAVALLEKYRNMDEEQREEVDLSLLNLRRACGLALQMDIFEATRKASH